MLIFLPLLVFGENNTNMPCTRRGLAVEKEIKAADLADGEPCYVSNGVRGFRFAVVTLR